MPSRVSELAGAVDVEWVAYTTFFGAIVASLANILFGWLSDRIQNRRIWVWGGLIASSAMLVCFPYVTTLAMLIGFIILWQMALNMMLGPLAAWAGDSVPDQQKGMLGGLLAFAPAVGALSAAIVTIPGLANFQERLWIVATIVALCVLPVLLLGKPRRFAELEAAAGPESDVPGPALRSRKVVIRMWFARLLVQICEAALFANVLFWFRSIDKTLGDDDTAQILSIVVVVAIPIAMVVGRWADRHDRPITPLSVSAAFASIGLLLMAFSSTSLTAIASYAVFGIAGTVFLSLHTSQTLRVLPKPRNRGRDLGIFNLTNTAPSLVMPWLVLSLVPLFGFPALLATLAVLAALAAGLLWRLGKLV
ncbi:MFS transporter [Altererythrobacter aquaemixtae]|uniref:MFS transporter n=2 Tax=Pontixanthobacter aquaemixtae TaxID=1958940 RepID=A0A844ZTT0_9SPHN|nr:MFS transporter [Pontixanthobacter aquaemixtae]